MTHRYHLIGLRSATHASAKVDHLDDVEFDTIPIGTRFEINATDPLDPYDINTWDRDVFGSAGYMCSRSRTSWAVEIRYSLSGTDCQGVLAPGAFVDCLERVTDTHADCRLMKRRYMASDTQDSYTCFEYEVSSDRASGLEHAVHKAKMTHADLVAQVLHVQDHVAKTYVEIREKVFGLKTLALVDQYRRMDEAYTPNAKGRALEDLVLRLINDNDGFEAVPNVKSKSEEIDVWVVNRSTEMFWQKLGPVLIVECKNWTSKCGKSEYVELLDKVRNRRGKCDVGVLVSWNGFTRSVDLHRLRSSTEPEVVILLDKHHLRRAVDKGIASVLETEWLAAVQS
jgi:restriction endonuclease